MTRTLNEQTTYSIVSKMLVLRVCNLRERRRPSTIKYIKSNMIFVQENSKLYRKVVFLNE